MATTIKGIYKGFKFISQIFVVKERELEIGYPTDVKHVAHIGWDGLSGNAPSWMNAFKTPNFSTSLGNMGERRGSSPVSTSNWSSEDMERSADHQQSDMFGDMPQSELPSVPKKHKSRNTKPTSSPKSSASYTRSSKATKSNATCHGREPPPDGVLCVQFS